MKQLGNRVKELRIKRGLTLKELGEAIQFNYSNLSKIERGVRKPNIELLESLASFFNVEISYFFEDNKKLTNQELLEHELITFSEEIKTKNITLSELMAFAEMIAKIKKTPSQN